MLRVDGRKVRASQRRSQRRDQILAAAREVFSRHGYHASSVADILKQAGIARGTLYLYFPGKREIFEQLLEEMFHQITSAVERIRTEPGTESPQAQMRANVERIIGIIETNQELTIILLREAVGLDSAFDEKLDNFYGRLCAMIEGAVELGQRMGLVRACNQRLVSYCIMGSVKEVMAHLITGQTIQKIDRHTLAEEIVEYVLYGLFFREEKGKSHL